MISFKEVAVCFSYAVHSDNSGSLKNQRVLLAFGLSILKMKADNELVIFISLPILFISVKVTCNSTDPADYLNFI